eukprot:1869967-Amphidinium_carterae.1
MFSLGGHGWREANQAAVRKSDPRMLRTVTPVLQLVAGVACFSQILYAGKTVRVLPNAVKDRIFVPCPCCSGLQEAPLH